jgi:D-mannonate dehydratase
VRGKVPAYTEVFLGEGDLDLFAAMRTYREVDYQGPFVSDHTPRVEGDTPWGHRGRSFSLGYMQALVQAVNAMPVREPQRGEVVVAASWSCLPAGNRRLHSTG